MGKAAQSGRDDKATIQHDFFQDLKESCEAKDEP
jgi:hypothetical protein